MKKILAIFTKKIIWIPSALVLVAVAVIIGFVGAGDSDISTAVVTRTNLEEVVSVTGNIRPAESVELAFESGGKLAYIKGDTGTRVYAGELLAYINSGDSQADLLQAEAGLKSEEARLAEMKIGAKAEEIDLQEAVVLRAESNLADELSALNNTVRESFTRADDAVRAKADKFFSNPRSAMPEFVISINSESLKREVEAKRKEAEVVLVAWQDIVNKQPDSLTDNIPLIKTYLHTLQVFFDALSSAINTLEAQNGLSATTIDTYKADVYSARTNVNSAMTNILAGEQTLSTARATLLIEKKTLALKNSPASLEDIKIQEALVDKARALVQKYRSELGKKSIVSPLNGVITKKSAKVGEIVGAQSVVISIISTANYEIETYVPEADIRKVNVGDKARITLDAYEDDAIFEAVVSSVEPAETEIDGVSTYKAVLQFVEADERIRSGMTANIDITTDKKESVLAVPGRAIHRVDEKEYIKIQITKDTKDVLVTTGIKSDSGLIEISGEVSEGDVVILEQ